MNPDISIIMPTYGVADFIAQAIESVQHQEFQNWELIVVNDGSPDNSADIATTFSERDKRIRVVSKPNGGLSDARNFGLDLAKGQYIHFFDPDDYLDGDFYVHLFGKAIEENADVVIAGYKVADYKSDGNFSVRTADCPKASGEQFGGRYGEDAITWVCYAWNKLFRREFLTEYNLQYEVGLSRIEDAEFMSRFVGFNPKVAFARQCNYVYVQRPITTLSKGFDSKIIDINARRVGIDVTLIRFFSKVADEEVSPLTDSVKLRSLIATINRLYSSSRTKSRPYRKGMLREIKKLMPNQFCFTGRKFPKSTFDLLTYFGMKYGHYKLIELLQKFR